VTEHTSVFVFYKTLFHWSKSWNRENKYHYLTFFCLDADEMRLTKTYKQSLKEVQMLSVLSGVFCLTRQQSGNMRQLLPLLRAKHEIP